MVNLVGIIQGNLLRIFLWAHAANETTKRDMYTATTYNEKPSYNLCNKKYFDGFYYLRNFGDLAIVKKVKKTRYITRIKKIRAMTLLLTMGMMG